MKRWSTRRGSAFKLFIVAGAVLGVAVAVMLRIGLHAPIWLAYLVGVNVVTIFAYMYDKAASSRQMLRVPERVLHIMACAGGTPAAAFSQKAFRHKTIKRSFRIWFWSILVLQAALLGVWLYYESGR